MEAVMVKTLHQLKVIVQKIVQQMDKTIFGTKNKMIQINIVQHTHHVVNTRLIRYQLLTKNNVQQNVKN